MTFPDYVLHSRSHWDKQAPDYVPSVRLAHGDRIRLLRESGFEIEDLIEVRPARRRDGAIPVRNLGLGAEVADRGGREGSETHVTHPRLGPSQ